MAVPGGNGGGASRSRARCDGVVVFCGEPAVRVPMAWGHTVRSAEAAVRALIDGPGSLGGAAAGAPLHVLVFGDAGIARAAERRAEIRPRAGMRCVGVVRRPVIEDVLQLDRRGVVLFVSAERPEAAISRACRELAFPAPPPDASDPDPGHAREVAALADELVRASPLGFLSEVAAQRGVDPGELRRLCEDLTGLSPRSLRARRLLDWITAGRLAAWTVDRIADHLGYADAPTMLRATRRARESFPPTPDARRPTPDARRPTPDARRPTPDAPRPTPHAPRPTPGRATPDVASSAVSATTEQEVLGGSVQREAGRRAGA
ncbi:MAG: hypothetical protein HMLKMBBP_00709 [Planctomycetes bacterium]|nr:hypothetical protein [Planctomycetota bacterium]